MLRAFLQHHFEKMPKTVTVFVIALASLSDCFYWLRHHTLKPRKVHSPSMLGAFWQVHFENAIARMPKKATDFVRALAYLGGVTMNKKS
jgi:hypothetical protein